VIAVIMIRRGLAVFPFCAYTVFRFLLFHCEPTLFVFDHSAAGIGCYPILGPLVGWFAYQLRTSFGIIWEVCAGVFNNYPCAAAVKSPVFPSGKSAAFLLAIGDCGGEFLKMVCSGSSILTIWISP